MGKYKDFKTYIRKKIGMVGVGEFVDDPIAANSKINWDNLFNNTKFINEYATSGRIQSYNDAIDILEQNSILENVDNMIDVGCGTGHFLLEVSKRFPNIKLSGTDFSEESINVSKGVIPQATLFISDIYKDNEVSDKFDIVVCSEVLEHLLYPPKALTNLLSILSSNKSSLVITIPNGRIDTYQGHINFWSIESWNVFISDNIKGTEYYVKSFLFNTDRNIISIITKKGDSIE